MRGHGESLGETSGCCASSRPGAGVRAVWVPWNSMPSPRPSGALEPKSFIIGLPCLPGGGLPGHPAQLSCWPRAACRKHSFRVLVPGVWVQGRSAAGAQPRGHPAVVPGRGGAVDVRERDALSNNHSSSAQSSFLSGICLLGREETLHLRARDLPSLSSAAFFV